MKFKIRDGFIVNTTTYLDGPDGQKFEVPNSYIGGQVVDLEKAVADDHRHKLEPADAASRRYLGADDTTEPAAG